MSVGSEPRFDYALIGGGLANGLIALAVLARRSDARLAVVEQSDQLGGNHTWSFHESDVTPEARPWLAPLVVARWPAHDVRFPNLERRIEAGYASISSARFNEVLRAALRRAPGARLITGKTATAVSRHEVRLNDGTKLAAKAVIDGRGPAPCRDQTAGYQKFVGMELGVSRSTTTTPILMDACVTQRDGFRFVYVLPFAPDRVLIEDTYYSKTPHLDLATLRGRVLSYARRSGVEVRTIEREESGVLPILARSLPRTSSGAFESGYRGGWFHPTTGYSLPVAARVAEFVAQRPPEALFSREAEALRREHLKQQRFCFFLNRLLFGAYPPEQRLNVLERFYQLPEETIARFYALRTTSRDRMAVLCGRPPRGLSLRYALTQGATP